MHIHSCSYKQILIYLHIQHGILDSSETELCVTTCNKCMSRSQTPNSNSAGFNLFKTCNQQSEWVYDFKVRTVITLDGWEGGR
jgi:hypothetical protein